MTTERIKQKGKQPKPLMKAELSLQFWKAGGTLQFTYTVQDGDLREESFSKLDYYRFGKQFVACDELNFLEKQDFANFCRGYLENLKERP